MASTSLFSPPWTPLTSISAVHVMTWVTRHCPAPEGHALCSQPQAYPPSWFPLPVLRLLVALLSSFIPTSSSPRTDFHWSPNNRSELCSPFTPRNQNPSHPHRARGVDCYQGAQLLPGLLGLLAEGEDSDLAPCELTLPLLQSARGSSAILWLIPSGYPSTLRVSAAPGPLFPLNSPLQSVFSRGTDLYRAYPRCCGRCKILGFSRTQYQHHFPTWNAHQANSTPVY